MERKLTVNQKIYPLEVIYAAAYVYLDKCYVFLERGGKDSVKVRLRSKPECSEDQLDAIVGGFENELLSQAFRRKVALRTGKVREAIVHRALFSALPESLDLSLDGEDEGQVVDVGADVVQPVGDGDRLQVRLVLPLLLDACVHVANVRGDSDDGLAIQLEDQPQHAVGGRVLGTHVEHQCALVNGIQLNALRSHGCAPRERHPDYLSPLTCVGGSVTPAVAPKKPSPGCRTTRSPTDGPYVPPGNCTRSPPSG